MPSETVPAVPSAPVDAAPKETSQPSRVEAALEALTSRAATFRSTVASAEEEVRSFVARRRGAGAHRADQSRSELGPFADGRIDVERFGLLLGGADALAPGAAEILGRAERVLSELARGPGAFRVRVEPGGDLRDVVKGALAQAGRVFGAARAVELARSGRFDPDEHGRLMGPLPFRAWNRFERELAPPVVVEVEPDDLLVAGLGEFLDGMVKLVLVVRGVTAPAPLARLVTPGTYVVQAADPAEVHGLAEAPHPGVALLFDEEREDQARFVHDPDAGVAPWQRLRIVHMPARPEVGRGRTRPLWAEELEHLETMVREPAGGVAPPTGSSDASLGGAMAAPVSGEAGSGESTSADRLAAWLLSQTDLTDLDAADEPEGGS